ncbi:T9SS type B sorting domain-containing protein [Aurantibacter sp.]|uniref:T9SS type B sorting domain-containing protein n=1 Tax=Aurantibacter sp. TaxID=2807103 RepID=UPI003266B5A1
MKKLVFTFLIFNISYSYSQQANDCVDAIIVCGNTNISSNATGFGLQELDGTNDCLYYEENSLWLSLTIGTGGNLAFNIIPNSTDLVVDYDFYIFGPNNTCGNLDDPIRCNTTNPLQAGLGYNETGLRDSETNFSGGPAELGNGYVSSIPVSAGEHYYILIDRPVGTGGFTLEWTGTSGFLPMPNIQQPDNIQTCIAGPSGSIDLTINESQITTSITDRLDYYSTYEDAFDDENAINNPGQYSSSGRSKTIYVRATNANGCFEIIDFQIEPVQFDNPPNLSYTACDNDRNNIESFSIAEIKNDIENSISYATKFDISLHINESNANNNTAPIESPFLNAGTGEIYARIGLNNNTSCYLTFPIDLEIITSNFPEVITFSQCDLDENNSTDGITVLNLNQAFTELPEGTAIFYESNDDLINNIPISNPKNYSNTTPFKYTIYYKSISETCNGTGKISIEIKPTTISFYEANPIITCDDDLNDNQLLGTFNIDNIKHTYFTNTEVSFFENFNDASLESNPILGSYRTSSTTVYIRFEHADECQNIQKIEFVVNTIPITDAIEDYQICSNGPPLLINGPNGFDSYVWYKINDDAFQEISTTNQVSISVEGDYFLEIGNYFDTNENAIICTNTFDFKVSVLHPPVIEKININNDLNNNSIEILMSGESDYEFSIDNENYQKESHFYGLESGLYTVFVQDINGCGITEKQISILGFPNFFTPNGDGVNDTWQVTGLDNNVAETSINIYDRYGKLVKQINTNDIGWDGSMGGALLPSSDYWFRVSLNNGQIYQGHFTLKR